MDKIDGKLREISLKIHGKYIPFQFYSTADSNTDHPETNFNEK